MYILVTILAWIGIGMITFELSVHRRSKREAISWLCIFAVMTVFTVYVLGAS